MPSQRSGMAVALFHDRILAIGGERGGGTFTNNEAYDPQTNSWSVLAPLPQGRHGTGAVVIGDTLYLPAGGPVNGGSRQSDTLLHVPVVRVPEPARLGRDRGRPRAVSAVGGDESLRVPATRCRTVCSSASSARIPAETWFTPRFYLRKSYSVVAFTLIGCVSRTSRSRRRASPCCAAR